ncbi:laccase-3-like [Diprion similis]|uniref:laccase-3-like n=1 Tax=Diprion similis TaxID=362088 RepID=UPI001EF7B7BE|nr:laccase-3-like [Diprion similis]
MTINLLTGSLMLLVLNRLMWTHVRKISFAKGLPKGNNCAMISSNVNRFAVVLASLLILISFADADYIYGRCNSGKYVISSPHECRRPCIENEQPKICHYHFHIESFITMGSACVNCTPTITNQLNPTCQCVTADGIERAVLTVNRMIPGPSIQVCKGDHVVIDVTNAMDAKATSIHWHGIYQYGSQYYDGVPFVTQCPIADGNSFRYQWHAENEGTQFWHSHHGSQRIDGLYGSIVIRTPKPLHRNLYDYDRPEDVIVLSDWFHASGSEFWPGRYRYNPGQGAVSVLIQGLGQYTNPTNGSTTTTPLAVVKVKPGKRYRIRFINACTTVCPSEFSIEGHDFELIAADGADIVPATVNSILTTAGERYDLVIKTHDSVESSWWIRARAIGDCTNTSVQQFGILQYEGAPQYPVTPKPGYNEGFYGARFKDLLGRRKHEKQPKSVVGGMVAIALNNSKIPETDSDFDSWEVKNALPITEDIRGEPDIQIMVPFSLQNLDETYAWAPRTYQRFAITPERVTIAAGIGTISHVAPTSPLLSQIEDVRPGTFCNQSSVRVTKSRINRCTHVVNVKLGDLVEIVPIDLTPRGDLFHPFHLHGYQYYVLAMGANPDPVKYPIWNASVFHLFDKQGAIQRNFVNPPLKDTTTVTARGYAVLRFRAFNPGYWLMHCHFDYHMMNGMQMIMHVGEKTDLPPVPPDFPKCKNYKPPIVPRD